jgi:hypothetical protein
LNGTMLVKGTEYTEFSSYYYTEWYKQNFVLSFDYLECICYQCHSYLEILTYAVLFIEYKIEKTQNWNEFLHLSDVSSYIN